MTSVNDRHTKKKDVVTDTKTDYRTSVDDRHTKKKHVMTDTKIDDRYENR